jgi:hypothetical protein
MVGGSRAARDLAGPRRASGPGGRKAWAGVERGAPRRDARDVAGPRVRPRAVPRLGRARRPHLQPPLRARPGRRGGCPRAFVRECAYFSVVLPLSVFLALFCFIFLSLGALSNPFSCRLFLFVVGVVFAHTHSGLARRASLRARWIFLSIWTRNCHPSMRW